jgi:multidrug efflux pump subunit AcrA (membrane-fusion protein)
MGNEEMGMTLEDRIDRLESALSRLAEAQARAQAALDRLAEAQARAEARLDTLAAAQVRTEAALDRLAEAQARTEARLDRVEAALVTLAEAQARTETAVQETQRAVQELRLQVGGLSETVGGDLEDIAYIVVHEVLGREFGWQVGVLERAWRPWEGEAEEVDVFGRATDPARPGQPIWIVGEAKHTLTLREVERFARQVERARRHLRGEVYAVCFAYRARPEVRARLQELGIPLVFSYGRFAGPATAG